jgi:hypothetical protein
MTCTWGNAAGSVTVRSVNACGQSAAFSKAVSLLTCMTEQGDAPVALRTSELNVYPNPNTGLFTVQTNLAGRYQLLNGMGQLLEEFSLGGEQKTSKDVQGLTAGVYYIRSLQDGTMERVIVVE